MDLSLFLSAIYRLIDEIRYGRVRAKGAAIRPETKPEDVYDDLTELIDRFRGLIEYILGIIRKVYPSASVYRKVQLDDAEFVEANIHLTEIYTGIKTVTRRLEEKLTKQGFASIESVTDRCLQLVIVEGMVGVEAASRPHFPVLPIRPGESTQEWLKDRGINEEMDKLPFDHPRQNKYVLDMNIYFSEMYLRLLNCKESLIQTVEPFQWVKKKEG